MVGTSKETRVVGAKCNRKTLESVSRGVTWFVLKRSLWLQLRGWTLGAKMEARESM